MSFSPGNTTKQAENNLGGTSNLLLNKQFPELNQRGGNLMDLGTSTTQPGVNFFKHRGRWESGQYDWIVATQY
jgi:hypothetical protein